MVECFVFLRPLGLRLIKGLPTDREVTQRPAREEAKLTGTVERKFRKNKSRPA